MLTVLNLCAGYCRYLDSCVVRWIDPCGDQVRRIDVMLYRETFRNALYYDIYIDGLYLLFLCVGPMTTLIFMNARLVQAIRYSDLSLLRNSSSTDFTKLAIKAADLSAGTYNQAEGPKVIVMPPKIKPIVHYRLHLIRLNKFENKLWC